MNAVRRRPVTFAALLGALAGTAPPGPAAAQSLTLSEVVASALETDPSIRAASAHLTEAEEGAAGSRAARLPAVGARANLTRFQEPMVVAPLHTFDPTAPPIFDRTLLQAQLVADYTIFDGGGRGARTRAAEAGADAARHGVATTEMDVLEGVVAAYLSVLTTRSVLEAAQTQVTALESELDRVERNRLAGTAAEVEVLRARASLEEARADRASAEARVGLAERSLARVSGLDSGVVASAELAQPSFGAPDVPGKPSAQPAIEGARLGVFAAEARAAEQRAGRLPRLSATVGVLDFGTLQGDHAVEWQAGLQLSWPIFTGGARASAIRRADAGVVSARGALAVTERRVAQAVDAAETAVAESSARATALEAAVTQWQEVARIEELALRAGSGVQRDLLRAQAGLFLARAGHARASHDETLARVRLAKALGTLDQRWIDSVFGEER